MGARSGASGDQTLRYTQRLPGIRCLKESQPLKLRKCLLAWISFVLALASVTSPNAQSQPPRQPEPKFFQDLHWRLIGPFRGGRALVAECGRQTMPVGHGIRSSTRKK
jgi:hypothetical protein